MSFFWATFGVLILAHIVAEMTHTPELDKFAMLFLVGMLSSRVDRLNRRLKDKDSRD